MRVLFLLVASLTAIVLKSKDKSKAKKRRQENDEFPERDHQPVDYAPDTSSWNDKAFVLYILVRHGLAGLLGWFYLFAFCTLRLVGGAMSMQTDNGSGNIISNVGLSPLLLAASGILHESRIYRLSPLNKVLEWTIVALFHVIVATGVALLGVGASALQNANPKPSDLQLVEIGIGILTASWAILCVWTAATLFKGRRSSSHNASVFGHGTTLLMAVILALPFIGIRVLYSLVALCTRKAYLNPVTGSLTVRILLSFLPELITTLLFIAAGIRTDQVARAARAHDRQDTRRQRGTKHIAPEEFAR